jgi:hypothetical protein
LEVREMLLKLLQHVQMPLDYGQLSLVLGVLFRQFLGGGDLWLP